MKAAIAVKPDSDKGITAQGFYVMNADGKAYGFNNNRSVERVTAFAERSLEAFKSDAPVTTTIRDDEVNARWHAQLDEGGASIRIYSRIRPLPDGAHSSNANVARDHFWLYPSEIAAISQRGSMPEDVVYRLARFQFVDDVRGEPEHWQESEVKQAIVTLKSEGKGKWTMKGDFQMETADGRRGMSVRLTGRIEIRSNRLREFLAYGEGVAWGQSTYTPNPPSGRFPIVFAFRQTDDRWSKVVTPQAVFYGAEYRHPLRSR